MRTQQHQPEKQSDRRGAAMVEMAMVAPLFFLLVFGLIEFARMVMVQHTLSEAARAGCRKAALVTTNDQALVNAAIRSGLGASMGTEEQINACQVTVTPSNFSGMDSETEITTTVEVNYSEVSWIPTRFLGNSVLRGISTMKRE